VSEPIISAAGSDCLATMPPAVPAELRPPYSKGQQRTTSAKTPRRFCEAVQRPTMSRGHERPPST